MQISLPSFDLQAILSDYCWWDLPINDKPQTLKPEPRKVANDLSRTSKKKKIEEVDFTDKIALLSGIIEGILKHDKNADQKFIIKSKRKPNPPKGKRSSKRRSQYIGVSQNGSSYQVLISVNGKKTYLGSFDTEHEAAVKFDYYSILLHSIEAKTNFSYTARDIADMIQKYN